MSLRSVAATWLVGVYFIGHSALFVQAAESSATEGAAGLDEVVVTAQRRRESAQNVGIALSVVGGDLLREKSISKVSDLRNAAPSLEIEPAFGGGQPQYRLRGVGFLDYTANNTSPVGVNVDQVPYSLPIQTQGQLFDLDRIEVLRGPQGTLYGRNTTGGAVNFITNAPTQEPHAGVTAEYGSYNEVNAEGFVSGPLADGLFGRLSVATDQGGAWQRDRATGRDLGDKDEIGVRGQLEWDPASGIDLHLGTHWSRDRSDQQGLRLLKAYTPYNAGTGGAVIPADTSPHVTGFSLDPAFASVLGVSTAAKPSLDNISGGADFTANLDLGFAKLTTVSAYNKLARRELSDWDATQYYDSDEYLRDDLSVFSQELRLASSGAGPFAWVGGVLYSKETLQEKFYSDFSDANIGFPPGTTPQIALNKYEQDAKSLGVFGQVNYRFTDSLNAIIGAREDHETRDLRDLNTSFLIPPIPSFTGGPQSRSSTSNLPSGKVALEWQPIEGTLTYASVSRGVKSGGYTAHNTLKAAAVDPFKPEKLTAYEIGVKSDLTQRLRVNAAVFYYRYHDEQLLSKVLDDLSKSYVGRFVNADSVIGGADLDLEWRPVDGLTITQYAGWKAGHYTGTLLDSNNLDFNGKPLSFPKLSYGGDISYAWNWHEYKLTSESNYSYHAPYSQLFLLGSNDFTIRSYWLANANVTLSPAEDKSWGLTVWGRNVFNRRYDLTRNFFLPGTEVAQSGEPATVGVRVSYKY